MKPKPAASTTGGRITRRNLRSATLLAKLPAPGSTPTPAVGRIAKNPVPQDRRNTDDDALCRQFGVQSCRVVIRKLPLSAADSSHPPLLKDASQARDDDALRLQFRAQRCSVRLLRLKIPTAEKTPLICRSPSPQYSPVGTPQSHRSRSSTPVGSHHVPVYKSSADAAIRALASASPTRPTPAAAATSSPSSVAGANVYEFLSMSQEDDCAPDHDDPMREVIAKLQHANRIQLKHKRRGKLGIAASSKPAMKRVPGQTQKQLQQLKQLRTLVQKTAAAAVVPVLTTATTTAAAPPPLPPQKPPPLSAIHRRLLAASAHLKPITQSTPIRTASTTVDMPPSVEPFPLSSMHASTPIVPVTTQASTARTAAAQAAAASPWRVTDEQIPSTSYFCTSLSDQLPSYSSDILTFAVPPPPQVNAHKRAAEEALAAAMETQKRPKIHTDVVEQQPQKRLNFSEEISPPVLTDDDHSLQETPSFSTPTSTTQPQPSTSAAAAAAAAVATPVPQLNNSDIENLQPPNHHTQLAAAKAKATRVVLGERGKAADRMPLQPLVIRNVFLSPPSPQYSAKPNASATFNVLHSSDEQSPPDFGVPMPILPLNRLPVEVTQQHASVALHSDSSTDSAGTTLQSAANEKTPVEHTDVTLGAAADDRPHNHSLAECFGFDSGDDSSDGDENRGVQMVKNPFAIRARMQGLKRHIPAVRRSGPRRIDTPLQSTTRPTRTAGGNAAVTTGLFRELNPASTSRRPGGGGTGAIQQSMRQLCDRQRDAQAAEDGHDCSSGLTVMDSFQSFVRGVDQPKERRPHVDAADAVLFEARWPEQHQPNRKSYTRQPRKRFCYRDVDSDDDEEEEEDTDADLSTGEQRKKLREERKAQRKKAEEAQMVSKDPIIEEYVWCFAKNRVLNKFGFISLTGL